MFYHRPRSPIAVKLPLLSVIDHQTTPIAQPPAANRPTATHQLANWMSTSFIQSPQSGTRILPVKKTLSVGGLGLGSKHTSEYCNNFLFMTHSCCFSDII